MEVIRDTLRWIGWDGKLTAFGFTTDEIAEICEEDAWWGGECGRMERVTPTREEREEMFFKDGVSREWAFERRSEYLKSQYEHATRRYWEEFYAPQRGEEHMRALLFRKNRERLHYRIHLGEKTSTSPEDIVRAHKTPLTKVIGAHDPFVPCVFHSERTPSLHLTENLFYCFGCGTGGDAIDFVMHTQKKTFPEAVVFLNQL